MNSEKVQGSSGAGARFYHLGFCYPVVAVRVFGKGVVELKRDGQSNSPPGGPRGQIRYLSARARSKLLFTLSVTHVKFKSLLTLTYPRIYPKTGLRVKEDLNRLRTRFSRRFPGEMFWFLEFQRRGAPHFHIFSTWASPSENDRVDLARMWVDAQKLLPGKTVSEIVSRETIDLRMMSYVVTKHEKTWGPVRLPDACVRYAAKYALKTNQKTVPKDYQDVGRFWGCSKGVRENAKEPKEYSVDDDTMRAILQGEDHVVARWENYPKYLFGVKSLI